MHVKTVRYHFLFPRERQKLETIAVHCKQWEKDTRHSVGGRKQLFRRQFGSNSEHFKRSYYIRQFRLIYALVFKNNTTAVIYNHKGLLFIFLVFLHIHHGSAGTQAGGTVSIRGILWQWERKQAHASF